MRIIVGADVVVRGNRGQGFATAAVVGFTLPEIGVDVREPGLSVTGSTADGLDLVAGDLWVDPLVGLTVSGNDGHGVRVEGSVSMPMTVATPMPTRVVAGNGAGATCERWTIDDADESGIVTSVPCDGGGLRSESDIDAHYLTVQSNTGPGVYAAGDLSLTDSTICNNTGAGIDAGGTTTLTRVSTSCP
jgi:hypothetical protein